MVIFPVPATTTAISYHPPPDSLSKNEKKMNFNDAVQFCVDDGKMLAAPRDEDEWDDIDTFMASWDGNKDTVWLGIKDLEINMTYGYLDGKLMRE